MKSDENFISQPQANKTINNKNIYLEIITQRNCLSGSEDFNVFCIFALVALFSAVENGHLEKARTILESTDVDINR